MEAKIKSRLTFRIHALVRHVPRRRPGCEHGGVNVAGLHASRAAHTKIGSRLQRPPQTGLNDRLGLSLT